MSQAMNPKRRNRERCRGPKRHKWNAVSHHGEVKRDWEMYLSCESEEGLDLSVQPSIFQLSICH
jgi:hypothetical protein